MSEESREVFAKQKITPDFILDLYDEIDSITDPEEKRARMAAIEVLSEHMGEWLVLDEE